jgi:hypothetical protein
LKSTLVAVYIDRRMVLNKQQVLHDKLFSVLFQILNVINIYIVNIYIVSHELCKFHFKAIENVVLYTTKR